MAVGPDLPVDRPTEVILPHQEELVGKALPRAVEIPRRPVRLASRFGKIPIPCWVCHLDIFIFLHPSNGRANPIDRLVEPHVARQIEEIIASTLVNSCQRSKRVIVEPIPFEVAPLQSKKRQHGFLCDDVSRQHPFIDFCLGRIFDRREIFDVIDDQQLFGKGKTVILDLPHPQIIWIEKDQSPVPLPARSGKRHCWQSHTPHGNMSGMTATTPMMAQWRECKEGAKDALLFFRLGDFYEAFYDDAKVIAKEIGLTLTSRQGTPMCGVPYHTSELYIDKLVAKGFKIAVAEQVEDPKEAKGIVRREIVRTVTPGTLVNSQLLSEKKNNYFASIAQIGSTFGLGYLDLSTGELAALELDQEQDLFDELFRLRPAEFLAGKKWESLFKELSLSISFLVNEKEPLDLRLSQEVLQGHFETHSLDGFGLKGQNAAIIAAGSLLLYLKEERNLNLDHVLSIQTDSLSQFMGIDRASQRNLELTESLADGSSKNTLLDVLDATCTPMGGTKPAKPFCTL